MRRDRWHKMATLASLHRLEQMVAQMTDPAREADDSPCLHPEEARINLSGMGHRQFKCKLCGFEYKEQ